MNKLTVFLCVFILMALMANVADAFDFYGACVSVKEVSTSMWKMGINGNYPIIDGVSLNSPAAKAGLSQGSVILSINDRAIKSAADLDTFTTDILSVKILKGYGRETIIIDRTAIETEKAKRIKEEKKTMVKASPKKDTEVKELSNDDLKPIVFNDEIIEKKLGRSTPAELARQRQNQRNEDEKERAKKAKKAQKSSQGSEIGDDCYLVNNQLIRPHSYRTENVIMGTDRFGNPIWSTRGVTESEERQVTIEKDGDVWSFRITCGEYNPIYSKMTANTSQRLQKVACQ